MDRASKLVVFGWCCAALTAIVYFSRAPWPALPALTLGSFAAMALAMAIDRRAIGALLIFAYVFPIVIRTVTGLNYSPFSAAWTAGLLGAMAPNILRTGWHVPPRWRSSLVCWALVVVAGTLIVILREFDFTAALVFSTGVANSSAGGWPSFVVTWSLHTSLVLLSGLLWFDWLCGRSRDDFMVGVAIPLAASAALMAAVALYQMFVDVTVLNPTVYGTMQRASGTVMDANLCGTIAGLWVGGSIILIAPRQAPSRVPLLIVCVVVMWLAVWASGSRTGFATAAIVSAFSASVLWRRRRRKAAALGLAAAVGVALIISLYSLGNVVGPLKRITDILPSMNRASVRAFAGELWNRNGYGAIGGAIIRDHPWFGVGVGGFHVMQSDFARRHGLPVLAPDNSQNWYRQQLAEVGLIGSIPWIIWAALFGSFVLRSRAEEKPIAQVARGMVVACAAISLVGVPTQEVPASLTFWTAAFWYLSIADLSAGNSPAPRWVRLSLVAALVVFAAGTAWSAATSLRVPHRAQRGGWTYSYGFYKPGEKRFGAGPGWTASRAVAVFPAASEWVALTLTNDYRRVPGAPFLTTAGVGPTRAAAVRVWCNGSLILDRRLDTTAPASLYLHVPDQKWIMLESRVNRTIPLRELGIDDDRAVGVLIDWSFLEAAPGAQNELDVTACTPDDRHG